MKRIILLLMFFAAILSAKVFNVSSVTEFREALNVAATNGENNTIIIADGIYKTTDDKNGTFIYNGDNDKNLTIKGSNSKNVILSGDGKNQILNHKTSEGNAPLILENLSFIDGNSSKNGGAAYTDSFIVVKDCNFTNNKSDGKGGGFYSEGSAEIINSIFNENEANDNGGGFYSKGFAKVNDSIFISNKSFASNGTNLAGGGGFYSYISAIVDNSIFNNNQAPNGGGFFTYNDNGYSFVHDCNFTHNTAFSGGGFYSYDFTKVESSIFKNNVASFCNGGGFVVQDGLVVINSTFINNDSNCSYEDGGGGGFYSVGHTVVSNSIFIKNKSSSQGGGFYSDDDGDNVVITNSIFVKNKSNYGGGFACNSLKATNLLLKDNSSGIYLLGVSFSSDNNTIANSIFLDNNISDVNLSPYSKISKLENNYLDISRLIDSGINLDNNITKNNIFSGVNLGFKDPSNGDYHLTSSSDLIDKGTTDIPDITFPKTDLDGNARIIGKTIDIGPYEYNSSKKLSDSISTTKNLKKGWNLISMQESNLSKLDSTIKIIWGYKNSQWYAYSNDPVIQTKIKDANISELNSVNNNEGVWVFVEKDANITINTNTIEGYALTKGWSLLGTDKLIKPSLFSSDYVSYIWGYDSFSKQWKLYRNDGIDNYFNYEKLTEIKANSGFWVYSNSDYDVNASNIDKNQTQEYTNGSISLNKLSFLDMNGTAYAIALSKDETKAFVADHDGGLKIIDLSNPSNPKIIGKYSDDGYAFDIALSNDNTRAYLADNSGGLKILDISNPTQPKLLGSYSDNGYINHIALSKDNTKAYITNNTQIKILDIQNPSDIKLIGSYDTQKWLGSLTLSEDEIKIYVGCEGANSGLEIIDVSDPSNPQLLGTYDKMSWDTKLLDDGNKAYIATDEGFEIINVSNPSNIKLIGSYDTNQTEVNTVVLSKDNQRAYIAGYIKNIQVLDISNPSNIVLLDSYDTNSTAWDIKLSEDETKVYIANGKKGLMIVKIVH